VISVFRLSANEVLALLRCHAPLIGSYSDTAMSNTTCGYFTAERFHSHSVS